LTPKFVYIQTHYVIIHSLHQVRFSLYSMYMYWQFKYSHVARCFTIYPNPYISKWPWNFFSLQVSVTDSKYYTNTLCFIWVLKQSIINLHLYSIKYQYHTLSHNSTFHGFITWVLQGSEKRYELISRRYNHANYTSMNVNHLCTM
jgi:hypothetical protein